jgi:hypothetical protein
MICNLLLTYVTRKSKKQKRMMHTSGEDLMDVRQRNRTLDVEDEAYRTPDLLRFAFVVM